MVSGDETKDQRSLISSCARCHDYSWPFLVRGPCPCHGSSKEITVSMEWHVHLPIGGTNGTEMGNSMQIFQEQRVLGILSCMATDFSAKEVLIPSHYRSWSLLESGRMWTEMGQWESTKLLVILLNLWNSESHAPRNDKYLTFNIRSIIKWSIVIHNSKISCYSDMVPMTTESERNSLFSRGISGHWLPSRDVVPFRRDWTSCSKWLQMGQQGTKCEADTLDNFGFASWPNPTTTFCPSSPNWGHL